MTRQRRSGEVTEITDKHILVVDDDARVSDLVREVLDVELGCKARVANCASDALSQMAVQILDLVITDLHLPRMDGLDLMRRVQARYWRTDLILMAADMGPHVDQAHSRFRDSESLSKSFSTEDLFTVVEKALGQCV